LLPARVMDKRGWESRIRSFGAARIAVDGQDCGPSCAGPQGHAGQGGDVAVSAAAVLMPRVPSINDMRSPRVVVAETVRVLVVMARAPIVPVSDRESPSWKYELPEASANNVSAVGGGWGRAGGAPGSVARE